MNTIRLRGTCVSDVEFELEKNGEMIFGFWLKVNRASGTEDVVRVITHQEINYKDQRVEVFGELRTYSSYENHVNRLRLYVFAEEISVVETHFDKDTNILKVGGVITKKSKLRVTPLKRALINFTVKVESGDKMNFIPCIAWENMIPKISAYDIGSHVLFWGRLQSRTYIKEWENGEIKPIMTHEVSVFDLIKLREGNKDE